MTKIKWFDIRNDIELKASYSTLRILEKEGYGKTDEARSIKEAIREYYRKQNQMDSMGRVVKDYGIDGYILLQELPDSIESLDEANEYFEENMKIGYRDRGYDCTGQMFTNWYKAHIRHGKFYVYHSVGCDI